MAGPALTISGPPLPRWRRGSLPAFCLGKEGKGESRSYHHYYLSVAPFLFVYLTSQGSDKLLIPQKLKEFFIDNGRSRLEFSFSVSANIILWSWEEKPERNHTSDVTKYVAWSSKWTSELPSGGRPGQTLPPNSSTWLVLLRVCIAPQTI